MYNFVRSLKKMTLIIKIEDVKQKSLEEIAAGKDKTSAS